MLFPPLVIAVGAAHGPHGQVVAVDIGQRARDVRCEHVGVIAGLAEHEGPGPQEQQLRTDQGSPGILADARSRGGQRRPRGDRQRAGVQHDVVGGQGEIAADRTAVQRCGTGSGRLRDVTCGGQSAGEG